MAYGVKILIDLPAGKTLAYAKIYQTTDTGLGDIWDEANQVWDSAPAAGDEKIPLTEGDAGSYSAFTVQMGDFSGDIFIQIHDEDDSVVATGATRLVNGTDLEEGAVSDIVVSDGRTWRLMPSDDGDEAPNVITLDKGVTQTLAMRFGANGTWRGVLNPGTGLASVSTVTMTGTAVPVDLLKVSQDRTSAHARFTCDSTGERKVTFTCTTTDGDTVKGQGTLVVV
jgi:hypothetical protein